MTILPVSVTSDPDIVTILRAYNDVTERLKRSHEVLEREVCRLREELHEKNKELQRRERLAALGEMAAGVAHEIRNPLGGIGLFVSLLDRDLVDRPPQRELVRKVAAGLKNLEAIVGDILAFAGDAEPNRQPVLLAKIVDSALIQTAPQARALNIDIGVDAALESVELHCDPTQIERALTNLIFNALDAAGSDMGRVGTAHRGQVWIRVCGTDFPVGRSGHDGFFRIVVEDNGPGIVPERLQRVFDPFFTTKETGTGLGLAIVHRIAESNGGSISASHRSGGGAAFVLSVPLACESHHADAEGAV
ncbi:MAG: ATP-binding protein [Phycisphaerae bacterium]